MSFDFEAHVLTEDSAGDAHQVIATLLKKIFLFMDSACQTQRIQFRPLEEPRLRIATLPPRWNSSDPKDEFYLRDLGLYIATQLLKSEPPAFVFFHFDGDTKWSAREEGVNAPRFEERVRSRVRHRVRAVLAKRQEEARLEPVMARLRVLVPYYCVEAWAYQNLDQASALCLASCGAHSELLDTWEADRAQIDEVEQPWGSLCLGKKHNAQLVGAGFPADAVYGAEASFFAAVESLQDCPELLACIKATWDRDYSSS